MRFWRILGDFLGMMVESVEEETRRGFSAPDDAL
jgi:hypothetical protein